MIDHLEIAQGNIWQLFRPYVIVACFYCLVASLMGLFVDIVAFFMMHWWANAVGCIIGYIFLLLMGCLVLNFMASNYTLKFEHSDEGEPECNTASTDR